MRIFIAPSLLLAAPLAAQSLNVDVGGNAAFPLPASAHFAAGIPGTWNAVAAPASAQALVAVDGSATGATLTSSGGFANLDYDHGGTSGDDELLMDDFHDLGGPTSTVTWSFAGLAPGTYTVLTYAWAPDNASFRTHVSLAGSADPDQEVGGAWPGAQQLGVTHAQHRATVSDGTLSIVLFASAGFGTLNGIQLVKDGPWPALCSGDGSGVSCPCANHGLPGYGCASSVDPNGALLSVSGFASIAHDTLVLAGSGMPSTGSALYFQGTSAVGGGAGSMFGDGLRCAGGAVIRLGTQINSGGVSQYPGAGDASVSVRGACSVGDVRVVQVWYRNAAAFCTSDTFNLTNGVQVTWGN